MKPIMDLNKFSDNTARWFTDHTGPLLVIDGKVWEVDTYIKRDGTEVYVKKGGNR